MSFFFPYFFAIVDTVLFSPSRAAIDSAITRWLIEVCLLVGSFPPQIWERKWHQPLVQYVLLHPYVSWECCLHDCSPLHPGSSHWELPSITEVLQESKTLYCPLIQALMEMCLCLLLKTLGQSYWGNMNHPLTKSGYCDLCRVFRVTMTTGQPVKTISVSVVLVWGRCLSDRLLQTLFWYRQLSKYDFCTFGWTYPLIICITVIKASDEAPLSSSCWYICTTLAWLQLDSTHYLITFVGQYE